MPTPAQENALRDAQIRAAPVHPLIQGLVRELPQGNRWTRQEARQWLAVAEAAFPVIYELSDEQETS